MYLLRVQEKSLTEESLGRGDLVHERVRVGELRGDLGVRRVLRGGCLEISRSLVVGAEPLVAPADSQQHLRIRALGLGEQPVEGAQSRPEYVLAQRLQAGLA